MIALKLLLTVAGVLLLAAALGIPLYGLWLRIRGAQSKAAGEQEQIEPEEIAWRSSAALVLVACLPLLVATSIVVVPRSVSVID
jgi:high-affinity Fe2+/Pb2+ permease